MAADSELEEALKFLLIADGALVRAQSALGAESGGDEQVADLIRTATQTVRRAERQLWPDCDAWALVREGVW